MLQVPHPQPGPPHPSLPTHPRHSRQQYEIKKKQNKTKRPFETTHRQVGIPRPFLRKHSRRK